LTVYLTIKNKNFQIQKKSIIFIQIHQYVDNSMLIFNQYLIEFVADLEFDFGQTGLDFGELFLHGFVLVFLFAQLLALVVFLLCQLLDRLAVLGTLLLEFLRVGFD
jgi:hypothetical protein